MAICHPYIYTTTKDVALIKWKIPDPNDQDTQSKKPKQVRCIKGFSSRGTQKKDDIYQGHIDTILCVAASADGKFVATGGRDSRVVIWDAPTMKVLRVFKHHRGPVNQLVFRRGTNLLHSSSSDRSIKTWSLDDMAYTESLFGHEDSILDIDALAQETCVSVGGRDKVARFWRFADEKTLAYRGGGEAKLKRRGDPAVQGEVYKYMEGSLDCICMIDEQHFVTGGDSG